MEPDTLWGLQGSKVSESWLAVSLQGHLVRGYQKAFTDVNVATPTLGLWKQNN